MNRPSKNRAHSFALIGALVAAIPLAAQNGNSSKGGESYFGSVFRDEGTAISDGCNTKQTVLDKSGKPETESKPLKELVPGCLTPMFVSRQ
jgi:hypothetical protein